MARDEEQAGDAEALQQPIADLVNQRRLLDARELCELGRQRFPRDPWLATMQAYLCLVCGDSEDASAAASEALSLGSEDPLAWLVLGVTHRNGGRHEEAAEALMTAHLGLPDRIDAATMLVEEATLAHGFQRGKQVYEEVFERLPDHSLTMGWAKTLWAAGLYDDMPAGVVVASLMSVPSVGGPDRRRTRFRRRT